MSRAEAYEATCEAAKCRGGCLVDGVCTYTVDQESCNRAHNHWCQACSMDVWAYCGPWADCYAVCTGCCTTTDGYCPGHGGPEPPFGVMREDGPCSACAPRPEM